MINHGKDTLPLCFWAQLTSNVMAKSERRLYLVFWTRDCHFLEQVYNFFFEIFEFACRGYQNVDTHVIKALKSCINMISVVPKHTI